MRLWGDYAVGMVRDCNWLQHYENIVDPYHLLMLHQWISGDQFDRALMQGTATIGWEKTPLGVRLESPAGFDRNARLFCVGTRNHAMQLVLQSAIPLKTPQHCVPGGQHSMPHATCPTGHETSGGGGGGGGVLGGANERYSTQIPPSRQNQSGGQHESPQHVLPFGQQLPPQTFWSLGQHPLREFGSF